MDKQHKSLKNNKSFFITTIINGAYRLSFAPEALNRECVTFFLPRLILSQYFILDFSS